MNSIFGVYGIRFWRKKAEILMDVSFELSEGSFTTLLGPNGSGKSTLMKIMSGIIPLGHHPAGAHGEGQIRYRGKDFLSAPLAWRARQVTYVGYDLKPEFPLTAFEAVMLGRTCQEFGLLQHITEEDRKQVKWAMEKCSCWNLRNRELHTLSGGERQLVSLARALAQGSKVLLLDESLSQMDLHHQSMVGKMLRSLTQEGMAILLVAHDVNLASEWAEDCLLLNKGRQVAFGKVEEVLTETKIQTLYPGADLFIGKNPVTGSPKVFFKK